MRQQLDDKVFDSFKLYLYDTAGVRTVEASGVAEPATGGDAERVVQHVQFLEHHVDSSIREAHAFRLGDVPFDELVQRSTFTYPNPSLRIERELGLETHTFTDENDQVFRQDLRKAGALPADALVSATEMHYHPGGMMETRETLDDKNESTSIRHFIYDGEQLVAQLKDDGTLVEFMVTHPESRQPLWTERDSEVHFQHTDHRNSVLFESQMEGIGISERDLVDPYGMPIRGIRKSLGEILFALVRNAFSIEEPRGPGVTNVFAHIRSIEGAKELDGGVRLFRPAHGAYVTKDPAGLAAGNNLHGYANNNPGMYVDEDGRFFSLAALLATYGFWGLLATMAASGASAGAINLTMQYLLNKNGRINWGEFWVAVAFGAITGPQAGLYQTWGQAARYAIVMGIAENATVNYVNGKGFSATKGDLFSTVLTTLGFGLASRYINRFVRHKGSIIVGRDVTLNRGNSWVREEGYLDVVMHGHPYHYYATLNGQKVSTARLATLIEENPLYKRMVAI